MRNALRYIVSFIIFLHCTGVTQLVGACAKDSSTFISMLNMTEEETKKEKESKETIDDKETAHKTFALLVHSFLLNKFTLTVSAKDRIMHQYHAECVTPPPDLAI